MGESMQRLACPSCRRGGLYYALFPWRRPELDPKREYVECDQCHEIFQLERREGE